MTATDLATVELTTDPLERVVHLVCDCQLDAQCVPLDTRGPLAICGVRCTDGRYIGNLADRIVCPLCSEAVHSFAACPACGATP